MVCGFFSLCTGGKKSCRTPTHLACPNCDPGSVQQVVSAAIHMYACGQLAMSDDRVDHIPDTLCGWGIGFRALEDDAIEPTFLGTESGITRKIVIAPSKISRKMNDERSVLILVFQPSGTDRVIIDFLANDPNDPRVRKAYPFRDNKTN